MIDICTVVFRDEIPILKLQAESIGLYCKSIGVRNIYVVVNDDESIVSAIDATWWGDLAPHVIVIPRTVFGTAWVDNGWVSQQVLKILTASISYNAWTMVLDSKTIFTRELKISELLDDQGRMCVGQLPIYPVFEPSRQIVNNTYNIDLQRQLGPGGVPFFFNNDIVRFMIADTTRQVKQPFPVWFQTQGMLTEFLLYSGYVEKCNGLWNKCYSDVAAFQPVNICHSEVESFDRKSEAWNNASTLTVSIHRHAWEKLSEEQRTKYKYFLVDHGITKAWFL